MKFLVFNDTEIIDEVKFEGTYTVSLDSFECETQRRYGIDKVFMVVDDDVDTSTLTHRDAFNFLRGIKVKGLSNECERSILRGFEYLGDFFSFDYKDQSNFNQQLSVLLLDETITQVYWKTENNGVKEFLRDDFVAICRRGEDHKRENIQKFWTLKEMVLYDDIQSLKQLKETSFEEGIPEYVEDSYELDVDI